MSLQEDSSNGSQRDRGISREGVIKAIQTPLGLFALVVLAVEAILGLLAALSSESNRTVIIIGMFVFLGLLILVVAGMAIIRPETVVGTGSSSRGSGPEGGQAWTTTDASSHGYADGRRRALLGRWAGTHRQQYKGQWLTRPIDMELRGGGHLINGSIILEHPDGQDKPRLHLELIMNFFHDPYVKFDYRNRSETVLQFGCWVAQLNAEGTQLDGRFVGYGSITDRIVHGEFSFSKVA